jgi:hypothetical protein
MYVVITQLGLVQLPVRRRGHDLAPSGLLVVLGEFGRILFGRICTNFYFELILSPTNAEFYDSHRQYAKSMCDVKLLLLLIWILIKF